MTLLFVSQFVRLKSRGKSKYMNEISDLLFLLGALLTYLSPLYFLIFPLHLVSLFNGSCPSPFSLLNFILLPFYLLFIVSCMFLNSRRSLVTPYHLLIPIFHYLGTSGPPFNGVLAAYEVVSCWRNGPRLNRAVSLVLVLVNMWAVLEELAEGFNVNEEVIGMVVLLWMVLGYWACGSEGQAEEEQV